MHTLIVITAVIILVVTCFSVADLFYGMKSMRRLSVIEALQSSVQPMVSVIMPACNEEANIESAVISQLAQLYDNLEVIVINDRSTDATASVLQKLQKKYRQLIVLHVDSLPQNWMGKAHALQLGAEKARGEYLLFTDGDIIMEKNTIARAVRYMVDERLDHLCLIFKNISSGWLLNSLILDSGAALFQIFRPWLARKKAYNFIGVGAFNMIKKSAYTAINRHEEIKMHPIDDIMLGKLIKRKGFSQECLMAPDLVAVPWYGNITEMINGLMKNVLAIINYRFYLLIPMVCGMILLNILPLWMAVFTNGFDQLLWVLIICIKIAGFYSGTRVLAISPWCALGTLVTPYLSLFIVIRAAWCNLKDDGIVWRGTHYPLEKLRENEPILP